MSQQSPTSALLPQIVKDLKNSLCPPYHELAHNFIVTYPVIATFLIRSQELVALLIDKFVILEDDIQTRAVNQRNINWRQISTFR